jgi:ABC-type microcin C transport system duplicated ATPase subunit YejF
MIVFDGRDIDGLGSGEMRPLRREMQIVFQDPFGSLSPAHVGGRDRRRGAARARAGLTKQEREAGSSQALARSASIRRQPRTAIRTNSPAASASASPSPAP